MKISILGPPGAGKGTQAKRVSQTLVRYTRVSTGDLVRSHIEAGTELGREINAFYERGEPVPDDVILGLTVPQLQPAGLWILDGFPRNASQAQALDAALEEHGGGLDRVIMLEGLDDEELIGRILDGRRHSVATGMVYHLEHDPPPRPEDNMDPGPFVQRPDDTEEAIRRQLDAYHREAETLKKYYEGRGILAVVDAGQEIPEVTEDILQALGHPEKP